MTEFFNVLRLHRNDILGRLIDYKKITEKEAQEFVNSLSDEAMEHLASKIGDILMEGGDYWLAIDEFINENYV